jgi:uncharacterized protein (DUF1800 family)
MSTQADIAHLLRRATFGPFPGQVDSLVPAGTAAALNAVLTSAPSALPAPPGYVYLSIEPVEWWLRRVRDPGAGLVERMVWFWHGLLVSAQDKVNSWEWMWEQNLLFRQYALGNFRALMQAITIDRAMLFYLDGNRSNAASPNENFGRELMELFTLGLGNYTENDVKAGAKALAGWDINWSATSPPYSTRDQYEVLTSPVTYLGQQVLTQADVVNTVCNHPAMPGFITTKLYKFFHGVAPSAATVTSLSNTFTANNLEIAPVVNAILNDPLLFDASRRLNRPRVPFEWVTAAFAATGSTDYLSAQTSCSALGQTPYYPPNVAGWPGGMTWLSPSQAIGRADVGRFAPALPTIQSAPDPVAAALSQCSLYEVTSQTQNAMNAAVASVSSPSDKASLALGLAIASPEFALS